MYRWILERLGTMVSHWEKTAKRKGLLDNPVFIEWFCQCLYDLDLLKGDMVKGTEWKDFGEQ